MTSTDERQRRHDERFQKEVLNALDRIHQVMHDISDATRRLVWIAEQGPVQASEPPEPKGAEKVLLSVPEVAALLGMSKSSVYQLRYSGGGPTPTRIGQRMFFQRADVMEWLTQQREVRAPGDTERPWREGWVPGRIGSSHPATSDRPAAPWCRGSHSEPLAASKYSGRAVCGACKDDVLVNRDGRLRKHHTRPW